MILMTSSLILTSSCRKAAKPTFCIGKGSVVKKTLRDGAQMIAYQRWMKLPRSRMSTRACAKVYSTSRVYSTLVVQRKVS